MAYSQSQENSVEKQAPGCTLDSNMDSFFERQKSNVMYELRNIQHDSRPVTGQNHRDTLQSFMKKHMTSNDASGKENVPANVDSVEEHRPNAVVVEVQGIIEQRPVSSILQSAAFKRRLENIIRGSIQGVSSVPENQRTRVRANSSAVPTTSQRREPVRIPERPRLERSESTDSITSHDSFSSALSSADQDLDDFDDAPVASSSRPVPPSQTRPRTPPSQTRPSSSQAARRESARRQNAPSPAENSAASGSNPDLAFGRLTWNEIGNVHREELVQELSELVHGRLVSSALDGEFRATMEMHILDRVPENGAEVQEFVRSLPGRGIPRNDFSNLGIPPAPENDNWDNISVTSVSTHSVPYTQTNSYMSREIQSLKNQMAQMKNMLKISVDLQMDVQRAIRQEVAAALSQSSAQGASAVAPVPSKPVNDTECLICLERHSDSVLYQCGHMCVCYLCGKDLMSRKHNCPVCRAPIKDVIRAYKTN